ncbi:MAG TPA: energy transducer TonB [Archangium sp.]|uniref:energy transducer TonB n=1 Tax=Archangium sp. TaxID=1872627 RepID=UPI002E3341A0|nr:energy transducer TonB [Archangium sp.]HEX5746337.1 energy transducer TonB [Archangium sp.]
MAEAAMQRWERTEVPSESRVPASTGAPAHPLFSAVLQPRAEGASRGRFGKAAFVALAVHGAALLLLSVGASSRVVAPGSTGGAGGSREIALSFMVARAPAAPAPTPSPPHASRPAPVRRHVSRPARVLTPRLPAVEQPAARPPPAEPTVEATEEAPADVAEGPPAEAAPGAEAGGGGIGAVAGSPGGGVGGAGALMPPPPPPPPSLTREQRQSLTSSYLQELLRSRIAARFQYPPQAEELGLEGVVTLRVSIGHGGQLLGMRVHGPCPHPMLCDAALRTVRESLPFPPPPAELGQSIAVDVPFQYRLE